MTETERKVLRDALEAAWSHVARSIEIAEGDEDPPEDLAGMRADLKLIETAQGVLAEGRTP
jgi:hypothetical protein